MIEGVDNVGIAVENLDEAIAFYERLGFDVERHAESGAQVRLAEDSAYLFVFEGSLVDVPERDDDIFSNPVGIDHVSIRVQDIDETYNELTNRGVEFMFEPRTVADWGLRMTGVRDPSGNILYFIRYV